MKNLFFSFLATLVLSASLAQAGAIVDNRNSLFELAYKQTLNKQPKKVHSKNLSDLAAFIKFDVQTMNDDRAVDFGKPAFLHLTDANDVLRTAEVNPVVSLYQYSKYDPKNAGIGFCFGRAMFVHLELAQRGIDRRSVKKAFVVGSMQTPDGNKWGWHVTTIAQAKDPQTKKEVWYAIDPIVGSIIDVTTWYNKMRDEYSTDKKLKLFITSSTRLGPTGTYHQTALQNKFYNNYFIDMEKWFDQQSRAGKYDKPLIKVE